MATASMKLNGDETMFLCLVAQVATQRGVKVGAKVREMKEIVSEVTKHRKFSRKKVVAIAEEMIALKERRDERSKYTRIAEAFIDLMEGLRKLNLRKRR